MIDGGRKLMAAVSKAEVSGRVFRAQSAQWELFQKALDTLPEGFAVVDGANLSLRWANRAFYQHMGEPYPGVREARLHDFVPQAEESGLAEIFRRVAASGQACSDLEYEYNDFLNGPTYWRFTLRPLPAENDRVADLAVQVENVTAEVMARMSSEQRRARVKLRRNNVPAAARQTPGANRSPTAEPKPGGADEPAAAGTHPSPATRRVATTSATSVPVLQLGSWRYR